MAGKFFPHKKLRAQDFPFYVENKRLNRKSFRGVPLVLRNRKQLKLFQTNQSKFPAVS
jgi:hypothetical protein